MNESKTYKLGFNGDGSTLFGILIVNWLLTLVTLGIYYPWAKAKNLQYLYGATSLNNDYFKFHGTGKELFKGYIKAILIFAIIYAILFFFLLSEMPILGLFIFYAIIIAIVPIAIHGAYRYRMSRTSWRGIRFGYRGERNEFIKKFIVWMLLTIITFGIYGSWMVMNMRNYINSNIKYGDVEFENDGDGADYFMLNLKGYFLSLLTLGIYMFWWQKELFEYYLNNLRLKKDNQTITFTSTATAGDFFQITIVNLLIIIFTLGIGYSWVVVRTMKLITSRINMEGNIDLESVNQTEANVNDATGDDISDALDIDFLI
jgi:uncharacterized membrane protein YjgN (DUF898 family)